MNSRKVLAAEFWMMIALQTLGSVDIPKPGKPDSGRRKLPAPRYYAAACILFAILGLMAELNPRLARIASGIGGTAVLAALLVGVAGPGQRYPGTAYGTRLVNTLDRIAALFAPREGQTATGGVEPEAPDWEEV